MAVTALSATVYLDETKESKVVLELGDIIYVPSMIKNDAVLTPRSIYGFFANDSEEIYMRVTTCRNGGDDMTTSLNVNDLGTSYFVAVPEITDPYKFYVRKSNTAQSKE